MSTICFFFPDGLTLEYTEHAYGVNDINISNDDPYPSARISYDDGKVKFYEGVPFVLTRG